jgi:prolyl-tRNA synthetase
VGALIMAHSDDRGLVLPPALAPTQVALVPIFTNKNKAEVLGYAHKLAQRLRAAHTVELFDDDQSSPGWKFAEAELAGIPVRIEVGPRDMEKGQVLLVRRDTLEKLPVPEKETESRVQALLQEIQAGLFHRALTFRKQNTRRIDDYADFKSFMEGDGGFAESGWCGDAACEAKIKDETKATIRVLPLGREPPEGGRPCVCCGEQAKEVAVFAKAY